MASFGSKSLAACMPANFSDSDPGHGLSCGTLVLCTIFSISTLRSWLPVDYDVGMSWKMWRRVGKVLPHFAAHQPSLLDRGPYSIVCVVFGKGSVDLTEWRY